MQCPGDGSSSASGDSSPEVVALTLLATLFPEEYSQVIIWQQGFNTPASLSCNLKAEAPKIPLPPPVCAALGMVHSAGAACEAPSTTVGNRSRRLHIPAPPPLPNCMTSQPVMGLASNGAAIVAPAPPLCPAQPMLPPGQAMLWWRLQLLMTLWPWGLLHMRVPTQALSSHLPWPVPPLHSLWQ